VLVTELLRERWGYDGVIVADDVALNSMTRSLGADHAAVQALAAGCDAVIMLDPDPAKIRAVTAAISAAVDNGTLSKEKLQKSVARLTRWQEAIGNLNAVQPPAQTQVAETLLPPATTTAPTPSPPTTEKTAPPIIEMSAPATETKTAPAEPAKTEPAPATPEESRSLIEHTVGAGDTLEKVAQAYGVSIEDLKKWNALTSDTLTPGAKLKVYLAEGGGAPAPVAPAPKPSEPKPSAPTEMPKPAETTEAPASAPAGSGGKAVYTVAQGDTLASIGEKFKVAAADIKEWNGLDSDTPSVGTVLTIFLGGTTEAAKAPEPEKSAPAPTEPAPRPADSTPAPTETKAPEPAPATAEAVTAPAPAPAVQIPPDLVTEEYTVLAGDTVSKIARAHNTTNEIILALNGLKDANQIKVGQKLKVPKAAP
jgi:LysM repeat protein